MASIIRCSVAGDQRPCFFKSKFSRMLSISTRQVPPSSGGTCLVEMLNILENFDLKKQGRWSPATLHLMIEAMRRAYCDRARHLGDPAFTPTPAHLTSKDYARTLARG